MLTESDKKLIELSKQQTTDKVIDCMDLNNVKKTVNINQLFCGEPFIFLKTMEQSDPDNFYEATKMYRVKDTDNQYCNVRFLFPKKLFNRFHVYGKYDDIGCRYDLNEDQISKFDIMKFSVDAEFKYDY